MGGPDHEPFGARGAPQSTPMQDCSGYVPRPWHACQEHRAVTLRQWPPIPPWPVTIHPKMFFSPESPC